MPPSFSDYFSENNTIHSDNTRSANKVYTKYERTNYRRFSVRYTGAIYDMEQFAKYFEGN